MLRLGAVELDGGGEGLAGLDLHIHWALHKCEGLLLARSLF